MNINLEKLAVKSASLPLEVQKAHRFALTAEDMQEVIEYLDTYDKLCLLHDSDDDSQWAYACRGLLCAAIVAYCRPFSSNKSKGFAIERLDKETFDAVRERQVLHELLIEKRHTFIAHADWKARHASFSNVQENSISWNFPHPNVWEGVDVQEFRGLVEGIHQECLNKAFEAAKAAHQEAL